MEEKEESSERKKKETPCRNTAPCLSCPGQAQAGQRASESGEGCTLPTRELWESASKQPCRADVGRWWAGCRSPRSVHGHEWKAEVHWEWTLWAGLEVSTAQGKWTPSLSLGRTAQTDQRNLSATELRVTAATQGQEWGQINRGRYPCLWPKYKLKCKKRQRGAPAADTSSVRQPQAISPPTQCHWVLKPPLNKIYEYGGAGQGRATDLETVTF